MRKVLIVLLALTLVTVIGIQQEAAAKKFMIGFHSQFAGTVDVVAWQKGYFDKMLGKDNYTCKEFAQGKLMRDAVLSKSIDVGQTAARPFVGLIGKGSTTAVAIGVGSYWCGLNNIMVLPNSGLNNLKQLKGKKLATGAATSTHYGFTRFILPEYGMKESDFKVINTTTTERIPALLAKTVEFINMNEPTASIAEARGLAVRLPGLDWCKYDDPPFVIIADPRNLKKKSETFIKYLRAFLMAAKLFQTDYDEYIKAYCKWKARKGAKVDFEVVKKSLVELRMHPQIDERFYAYNEKMNKVLKKDGKVTKIVDWQSGTGTDPSFMEAAMKAENWQ